MKMDLETILLNKSERNIVLLGGSTAFSNYSSSDKTSISAYLSNNTKFSVVNRNNPGWNSSARAFSSIEIQQEI